VDLVYDYVEIRADQLHVYHDIYARIGNKWAHIMQTLAAHGSAATALIKRYYRSGSQTQVS